MAVYNPSGSGNVHIDKAISGQKKTGVVPPIKEAPKKGTKKVTKKNGK